MDSPFDLTILNARLVDRGYDRVLATIGIRDGKIAAIVDPDVTLSAPSHIDAAGKPVMPGVIDPHVHYHYGYNYRDNSGDYVTETASALLGGVTTALRMHRALTPYPEHLPAEIAMIETESRMGIGIHLTIQTEDQLDTFADTAEAFGISSFKLYIAYKGRAGKLQGIEGSDDGFIFEAMRRIGRLGGVACVHAENSEVSQRFGDGLRAAGADGLKAWEASRPGWTEAEAITRAGFLAEAAGVSLYIVHLSSPAGARAIEALRDRGVQVFAEASIQYLTTTYDSDLGGLAKVTPPLRSPEDVAELWDAVRRGVIDTIGTDHVAHTSAKAADTIWDVMPGFSGSGTLLPALMTFGYHAGHLSLQDVVRLLSVSSADIFGLGSKGRIQIGADADLVVLDVDETRVVRPADLGSAADYSIYQGLALTGWPAVVIRGGAIVMRDGVVLAEPGAGEYLRRQLSEPWTREGDGRATPSS